MELIAAAIVFLAASVPAFLALEIATPHPGITRLPNLASAEEAAASYLVAHPLRPGRAKSAANDAHERIAA